MRREYKSQLCGSVKEKKEQCEREREDETFYTEKSFMIQLFRTHSKVGFIGAGWPSHKTIIEAELMGNFAAQAKLL